MSLPWIGYAKLRPGRIHLYCVKCKRKMSNTPRGEYDPPRAEVVQTWCDRCGQGGKDPMEWFLDSEGKEIEWEDIEAHIAALGREVSDERTE